MKSVLLMTTITRTGIGRQRVSRVLCTFCSRYVALERYINYFLAICLYCAGSIFCARSYGVLFFSTTQLLLLLLFSPGIHPVKFRTNKKNERNELKPKNQNKKPTPEISFDETEKFAYLITCARCISPGMGDIIMATSQHGSQMALLLLLHFCCNQQSSTRYIAGKRACCNETSRHQRDDDDAARLCAMTFRK